MFLRRTEAEGSGRRRDRSPCEVLKNLIGGLLIDFCSLSMAPDYAAQKRAKSQLYRRISIATRDNQGRGINVYISCMAYTCIPNIPLLGKRGEVLHHINFLNLCRCMYRHVICVEKRDKLSDIRLVGSDSRRASVFAGKGIDEEPVAKHF
jgi:hypothetical protein